MSNTLDLLKPAALIYPSKTVDSKLHAKATSTLSFFYKTTTSKV